MLDATFDDPDLTTFTGLYHLGLLITGQHLQPDRAVLACRLVQNLDAAEADRWCRRCGCQGHPRGTVTRRLAHVPFGHRPTTLLLTLVRFVCSGCARVWRQDTTAVAEPRAKLTRTALTWALRALIVQRLTVARVAEALAVSWHTANDAVLTEGQCVLIADPARFDGVAVIGVDEHVWRHTRRGDKYVTVMIDLTPVRDGTGPARLLDMVEGRSKAAFATWLAARPQTWRDGIEVVAMDGFSGFKTATTTELPEATAVMDPFHVVRLAGDALDSYRRRVQQLLHGHRGSTGDPLYAARRVLHTGNDLLTDRQRIKLEALFDVAVHGDVHAEVETTWSVYQRLVASYRDPDRAAGRRALSTLIETLSKDVPAQLVELTRLGRTLTQRSLDVLAYFDRPGTSNGPTEAINGRLEHLRGSALGFRNLANYIARSLPETGGFGPLMHPQMR